MKEIVKKGIELRYELTENTTKLIIKRKPYVEEDVVSSKIIELLLAKPMKARELAQEIGVSEDTVLLNRNESAKKNKKFK